MRHLGQELKFCKELREYFGDQRIDVVVRGPGYEPRGTSPGRSMKLPLKRERSCHDRRRARAQDASDTLPLAFLKETLGGANKVAKRLRKKASTC
jgi:hypothetical protein